MRPPHRLYFVLQGAQETRAILLGEPGIEGLTAGRFAQMAMQIAHAERHPDARFRERLAGRAKHAGVVLQGARGQRDIGRDHDVARPGMRCDPVVRGVGARGHGDVTDERVAAGAQAAIADDMDGEAVAFGDPLDLGLDRAGVAIDINLKHDFASSRRPLIRNLKAEDSVALAPEDMDFISNFSTLWAVFLGAILATLGGFVATQMEWYLERRRRERNAALFFGEVLSTMTIVLGFAADTKKIGDPYGPITMRMFRSAMGEVDIYNRNRESLYDLNQAELRARIHTLVLRINMSIDGIFDAANTIEELTRSLEKVDVRAEERTKLEARIAALDERREGSFDFIQETIPQLRGVINELEPIARFSYDAVEKAVRNA